MPRRLLLTLLLFELAVAVSANAQSAEPLPSHLVDLSSPASAVGLPLAHTFAPFTCSSEGDIYVAEYGLDHQGRNLTPIPALYQISPHGEVKQISRPTPTDYKAMAAPGFFAGANTLVTLISASQPIDQRGQTRPGTDFYLSVSDSDGDHPDLIHLDLDFEPIKAAGFDSGPFIVLGIDPKALEPVLALLKPDGTLNRRIDVFRTPQPSPVTGGSPAAKNRKQSRPNVFQSIGSAEFAPWGSDILMVMPGIGDDSRIYRFRATGQVETVQFKLPSDEKLIGVLGSGSRDNWIVRARSAQSAREFAKAHVIENPEEFLYEVNPWTGEILRRLDVKGPRPGQVLCAADGKLSAVYEAGPSQPGAEDSLVFASTQR